MAKRLRGRRSHKRTEGRRLLNEVLSNVTQAEVAREVGAKQQYVSGWSRGASRPEPEYRDALQRVYGIPAAAWYSADELLIAQGGVVQRKAS